MAGVDGSRIDARTVALGLLCVAVLAFAAATLDTTTDPGADVGFGSGSGDERGVQGTPTEGDPGSDEGRPSIIDVDGGGSPAICIAWLTDPTVQAALLGGLVALFLVGRWYDDALYGLALVFILGYPGFFAYLLLTSCGAGTPGLLPDLSRIGSPTAEEAGGLFGGDGAVTSPTLMTQLLLVLVVGLLGVVAVIVLTSDHDQLTQEEEEEAVSDEQPDPPEKAGPDVRAIAEAAGRAADRIEREGEFENEVYRAWAEMTEPLSVDHPESSTAGEFAEAAVAAGMAREDVDHLTTLFAAVRYGGAEPTPERERAAVETLRRIEATYAGEGDA